MFEKSETWCTKQHSKKSKASNAKPWQKSNITLLSKHYINKLTLSKESYLKSFKSLELWYPNRYEKDLWNKVLNIDFGQWDAKII